MAEQKKSGGNFKAQSAARQTTNKKMKAARHQKRMAAQCAKTLKVPRGTTRMKRRVIERAHAAKIRSEAVNLHPIAVAMAEAS